MNETLKDLKEKIKLNINNKMTGDDITLKKIEKDDFEYTELYSRLNTWHEIPNAVVVCVDLEKSTQLNDAVGKENMPKVYSAAMSSVARIFDFYDADYVDIQGDGAFAIFWSKNNYARAISSAVSIRAINEHLVEKIQESFPKIESRGFKIGVADGFLIAKNIQLPKRPFYNEKGEPVWSGEAVNFAFKVAQQAVPGEIIILNSVFNAIKKLNLKPLLQTCNCGKIVDIWNVRREALENLPSPQSRRSYSTELQWCEVHGEEAHVKTL